MIGHSAAGRSAAHGVLQPHPLFSWQQTRVQLLALGGMAAPLLQRVHTPPGGRTTCRLVWWPRRGRLLPGNSAQQQQERQVPCVTTLQLARPPHISRGGMLMSAPWNNCLLHHVACHPTTHTRMPAWWTQSAQCGCSAARKHLGRLPPMTFAAEDLAHLPSLPAAAVNTHGPLGMHCAGTPALCQQPAPSP